MAPYSERRVANTNNVDNFALYNDNIYFLPLSRNHTNMSVTPADQYCSCLEWISSTGDKQIANKNSIEYPMKQHFIDSLSSAPKCNRDNCPSCPGNNTLLQFN